MPINHQPKSGPLLTGDEWETDPHVENVSTVAASGNAETLDVSAASVHDVTLTANCTFTFTGATTGRAESMTLLLRQDGTGNRTATWPGSVVWPANTAPTLSPTASAVDILNFLTTDGGTTWFGFYPGGGGGGEALANVFVGVAHPMMISSISTQLAANRIYLAKFSPQVDVTVTTANIYINTSNGNLDFGIYNAGLSSLLASVGTTASPGTGLRTFAFQSSGSVTMDAGTVYYLAMQCSSTTFRCPVWVPAGAYGTGHNVLGREDAASMPLPSSIAAVDAWEDGFSFPLFYFT